MRFYKIILKSSSLKRRFIIISRRASSKMSVCPSLAWILNVKFAESLQKRNRLNILQETIDLTWKEGLRKNAQNSWKWNPDASVVEMDTVYNNGSKGPFLQTFKFLKYDFLFCVYHQKKTSQNCWKASVHTWRTDIQRRSDGAQNGQRQRIHFSRASRNQGWWNTKNKTILLRSDGQLAKGISRKYPHPHPRYLPERNGFICAWIGLAGKSESHLVPYQFLQQKKAEQ